MSKASEAAYKFAEASVNHERVSADFAATHIENLLTELSQYQKVAAKAAEYIRLSPCDPDITKEQSEAWHEYGEAMSEIALAQTEDKK